MDMTRQPLSCTLRLVALPLMALLLQALAGCSCARGAASAGAGPAPGEAWVVERLYFGLSSPAGPVSDAGFSAFLAQEVTPRFPEGLTCYRAQGQWRNARGAIIREGTEVVEIACTANAAHDAAIAQIRAAYCQRFHQDSVMRTVMPVHADF
jgi:hypothetical protein